MAAGAAYILLPWVKHKLGAARYDLLCRWVAAAVQAAEQVFSEAGMGPYKKAYVMELLEGQQKNPRPVNVGTFLNSLSQSLAKIQLSGISAVSERRETEDKIVLTITIPK